jgi:hypothetical protein
MITQREPVMVALKALLDAVTFLPTVTGATTWASNSGVGRRLKLWSDVPDTEQPALFIAVHGENDAYQSETLPSKTTITANLFLYFKTNDPAAVPATDLNYILDGIDAAMAPSPVTGKQTLGGLVSHCRREGQVMLDPGDIDGQGLAIIPFKILVP